MLQKTKESFQKIKSVDNNNHTADPVDNSQNAWIDSAAEQRDKENQP